MELLCRGLFFACPDNSEVPLLSGKFLVENIFHNPRTAGSYDLKIFNKKFPLFQFYLYNYVVRKWIYLPQ